MTELTKFPVIDRVQKCFSRHDNTNVYQIVSVDLKKASHSGMNCLTFLHIDPEALEKNFDGTANPF